MSVEPWPAGIARHMLQTVDSTNAEAARLARQLTGPTWILGLEQTGGRGRRGRVWHSPRGNFHATLVMRPTGTADVVALRSYVAALALRDALVAVTGLAGAYTLKWPNDVLLNDGKLAGILLESEGQGGRIGHLAIGFGVNLIAAPDVLEDAALPAVSLAGETGLTIPPETLLSALGPAYARREAMFAAQGFAPIRADWLTHAARLGQPIRARTGSQTRDGIFETVDPAGALILRMADGLHAIPAAEVFF